MNQYSLLEFNIDGGIATITLNRPDSANAFNLVLASELNHAANRCMHDPGVRVVVLAARGKLFSAGGDLSVMSEAGDHVDAALKQLTDQLGTIVIPAVTALACFIKLRLDLFIFSDLLVKAFNEVV